LGIVNPILNLEILAADTIFFIALERVENKISPSYPSKISLGAIA
jgi:hypothetical protein